MPDATVQSIPQTSPTYVSSQSQYVPVAPVASAVAPQPSYQAQIPTSYQAVQAPSPYLLQTVPQSVPSAFAPQSPSVNNPWESAFNKVVGLLSAPVQSPFQAQPSVTMPPSVQQPQAYSPYSSQTYPVTPNSGVLTSPANLTSSPSYSQTSPAPSLSLESKQVIQAYGPEAPGILNQYALQLENVLDSAVAWGQEAQGTLAQFRDFAINEHLELNQAVEALEQYQIVANASLEKNVEQEQMIHGLIAQNQAYNQILTNPDILSDYTLRFFGPEGPYPVYESEAELGLEQSQFNAQQFIQPMPGAPEPAAPVQQGDFWAAFDQQMQADPSNAWRLLNMASPQVVQQKLFVADRM